MEEDKWMEGWRMRERWQCCWGRNASLEREVRDRVDGCIMEKVRKWWQRQKELG